MLKKQIFSLLLIIIFILISINLFFLKKIFPNVYISGIYIGGLNKTEALAQLQSKHKLPEKINIFLGNKKYEFLTSDIVSDVNLITSIDRAYNLTSSNNIFLDLSNKLKLIFVPINVPSSITINEDKLLELLLIASKDVVSKPVYPYAFKNKGVIETNSGKNGIEADLIKARYDITNSLALGKDTKVIIETREIKSEISSENALKFKNEAEKLVNKEIELKLDHEMFIITDDELISFLKPDGFSDDLIKAKILQIARKLNRSPQDSVFIVSNGKVQEFTPSTEGVIVNEDVLLNEIKKIPNEITIPVIKVAPKIKNKDINNLGIDKLLGKGFSTFKGSIPNRVHNVNLAQTKFKGILIPPNEIVSFNEILGDVSSFTGYKAAYVIKDGKTVLGDGGGVCQVSTTLFRAVLSAGLPVLERRAHAYRVGYYEQGSPAGLDATIYSPTTDFKFKNDTPAYLLIQPEINLNDLSLSFEIYGTSDGRISEVSKPLITSSIAPAGDLYVDDPTLKIGVVKQIEHRAYGAKVVFDYKVTRNGEELINQKFVSNYRPWQAVYLRGTKQ